MGGVKAGNIINTLNQRFNTSINCVREDNLRNFERLILRGDTFDRALIFEQAITEDGTMLDEEVQRVNLARLVELLNTNFKNYEIVFVCENRNMARIILQELMEIEVWVKILVKDPETKYYAKFFTDLVSLELKEFDREMVFDREKLKKLQEEENDEEEIIWSDEVAHSEGEILNGAVETEIEIDLDDWGNGGTTKEDKSNTSENLEAETVEEVEKVETSEDIEKQIELDAAEQKRIKEVNEKKKKRLFGLVSKR